MTKIYILYDLLRDKNSEIIWVSSNDSDQPGLASSLNRCITVHSMGSLRALGFLDADSEDSEFAGCKAKIVGFATQRLI